jgi:hypothetical protein
VTLPGCRWSEQRIVKGAPPIGECETRCDGCGVRFIAGEPFVGRMHGPFPLPIYVHPLCVAAAEAQAAA